MKTCVVIRAVRERHHQKDLPIKIGKTEIWDGLQKKNLGILGSLMIEPKND